MTYRSWHLITIRSIATSWAFAAKIISMINTAMSFGARLIGAEINLKQEEQEVKPIVAYSVCRQSQNKSKPYWKSLGFITYSKIYLPLPTPPPPELPTNTQHTVEGFSPLICKHCNIVTYNHIVYAYVATARLNSINMHAYHLPWQQLKELLSHWNTLTFG